MRAYSFFTILLTCVSQLNADEPTPMASDASAIATEAAKSGADRGKALLELPVKSLVSANPNAIRPLLISPSDPPGAVVQPPLDYAPKTRIESSTKQLVQRTAPIAIPSNPVPTPVPRFQIGLPRLDVGKGLIERPVENLFVFSPNGGVPVSPVSKEDAAVPETEADSRKKRIEGPIEKAITEPTTGDVTKRKLIELPVTDIVADESATDTQPPSSPVFSEEVASDKKPVDENPHVEPGKVNWHASFDAAKEAAEKSGKPVLLFHLMGQLDQRFT